MTDKTPKNQAENPVNTSAALAKTTDTARDGEPKSRALPQADALKARFKAGSIPLQTDFADLIDLANIGRQAVGGAEGQTGPANGFTLSSEGRLELKSNAGITVDSSGVGVKVATTTPGISVGSDGLNVRAGYGIRLESDGVNVRLKSNSGLTRGRDGIAVVAKPNAGITVDDSGVAVVAKPNAGITVDDSGVAVVAKPNAGITVDSGGVGVKVATTTPGISVGSDGLNVRAGYGIRLESDGVNVRLKSNSGLTRGRDGIAVVAKPNAGITVDSGGVGVKVATTTPGISVGSDGLNVRAGYGIRLESDGVNVRLKSNSGLTRGRDGIAVVAKPNAGITVDRSGVGLKNDAWMKMMCDFHGADFYAYEYGVAVFFCNYSHGSESGCVAYVYGRNGRYVPDFTTPSLNGISASDKLGPSGAITMLNFRKKSAHASGTFSCEMKFFANINSVFSVSLDLIAAPD